MKLLKEADKTALYEAALYNIDLLTEANLQAKVKITGERVVITGKTTSVSNLNIDWGKYRGGGTIDAANVGLTDCNGFGTDALVTSLILTGNPIKNFEGLPREIYGELWAQNCGELESLKGAPIRCDVLNISGCDKLKSFEYCPEAVDDIVADNCGNIASLNGLPKRMKMFLLNTKQAVSFDCDVLQCFDLTIESANTSLKGFDTAFKGAREISFGRTPIKSHILGLLRIDGLKSVHTYSKHLDLINAFEIINKHLPSTGSMKAILECQDELIEAGLDEYAKL